MVRKRLDTRSKISYCAVLMALISVVFFSSFIALAEETITIVDSAGRTVELPYPVKSVVALNGNVPEEMIALGAGDKIVGIGLGTKTKVDQGLLPGLEDVAVIGDEAEPNYEKIAELDPDVVIQYSSWPPTPEELQAKLDPFGIPVVALDLYMMEVYNDEVELLGRILGNEKEAADYIAFIQDQYDLIDERLESIPEEDRKVVYFEGAGLYETYGGADFGCGIPGMIRAGGGKDLYPDLKAYYFNANPEDVAERNPDVIFKGISEPKGYFMEDETVLKNLREEVMSRPMWSDTTAVKNGEVYAISFDATAGLRKKFGPLFIAKALYPETFSDLDPESFLMTYLEDYLGLEPQGFYIYPPL